ncbi:nucleotidyltransferase [Anaerobranca californiensis]|jgi:predicted nucleotidyltransferase|nr:nucleotidyltransferase [Anaerobranca californiensis]
MEKVLGVIIEYNPFHNGHLYHLEKAKELTGCRYVVGVMSGNYVQRGEPAIINKWARTEIALNNGVDLVIELPTVYATQSAEGFAKGAVNILANTGIVTHLVFGSEKGDINSLKAAAQKLLDFEEKGMIKEILKKGISYSEGLKELLKDEEILKGSNNILAVEYLKEILRKKLPITVDTIKRFNNNYNDENLPQNETAIASATALRPLIKNNNPAIKKYIPESSYQILIDTLSKRQIPASLDQMSEFFFQLLLRDGTEGLKKMARIEIGLENRIFQKAIDSPSITELIQSVRSKRFAKSRISRIILHFILNLNEELLLESNENPGRYLRILGCSTQGLNLLKSLKNNCNVPFSLNYSKLLKEFNKEKIEKRQLLLEDSATNIYTKFFFKNFTLGLEYTENAIIFKK